MRRILGGTLGGLIVLAIATAAWAQATAQLTGRVTDDSGAVLPGVTVTATQTATGFTRAVVTDATGAWVMPNLPLGPYRLEVALQSFKTYVQTGIVLQVNANVVINAALGLGTLEETVTVDAAAPLVDVKSAGISEVVEQERIVELPLQGRQVTDLIVLAGGAVNTGRVSALSTSGSVAISVAGGLRNGVEYQLDGSAHNSPHDNSNLPFPFPDALQEFSVGTGGLAAATGMHSTAAVNAVTKSGTNAFHGNGFEFLRDARFNSPEHFAPLGPDGKQVSDGLSRNQFGGTFGGPIKKDKLFFFGGYQRDRIRQQTQSNVAWVPTAAMIAGDFTAYASAACNTGGAVTLRAPFVNNRVAPSQLSPAAVKVATSGWLPIATDPCGRINYPVIFNNNDEQYITRVDYQMAANNSIFGRFLDTFERRPPTLSQTHDIMTVQSGYLPYRNRRASMLAMGDTQVFGANTVNSFRFTFARTRTRANGGGVDGQQERFFDAADLGIPNVYTYVPDTVTFAVQPSGFQFSGNHTVAAKIDSKVYHLSDDLSKIMGRHQLGVGFSVQNSWFDGWDYAGSNGTFTFNGRNTGLILADFLTGQMSSFGSGGPNINTNHEWYIGVYGQDAWRVSNRITLNLGMRWDPYQGIVWENGTISNFSLDNVYNGVHSTQFPNAPPGLLFPGDPGVPPGTTGFKKQWLNVSPRLGAAWDVKGNGRTAIRSSYALNYDYPSQAFLQSASNIPPFNNRLSISGNIPLDNPYSVVPGGPPRLPTPIPPPRDAAFPQPSSYAPIDPNINSMRVQAWNATLEQQIGDEWQVAATYLGSYMDRMWGEKELNPGVYLGPSSTAANTESRRVFTLANPTVGRYYSSVALINAVGTQSYRGLKLSVRRRAVSGLSFNANYTVSHCTTDSLYSGLFIGNPYTDPENPEYDRGNCPYNRSHITNATVGYQTPTLDNAALRVVASNWRLSGVLNTNSGNWLTVTTTSDPARTGIGGQRVDQVLSNPYGDKHSLDHYLNPAAFAVPAVNTLGNHKARSISGPSYWQFNLAIARVLDLGQQKSVELRIEAFNLFNTFNWGDPVTNLNSPNFGQITTQQFSYGYSSGPRVMQFAVKYGF